MEENEESRFRALAATDPGKFLYEVYRGGFLSYFDVELCSRNKKGGLKRTWAVNPAYDSIKLLFNDRASGDHRSLRRALRDYTKELGHKFTKYVETPTAQGRTVSLGYMDMEALTPAALIERTTEAIRLMRALAERHDDINFLDKCNFCEETIIPLLQKMPPDKSVAQYQKLSPPPLQRNVRSMSNKQ